MPNWRFCLEENEYFEALLPHIEERRVIPVVGPGLLSVSYGGGTVPLYRAVGLKVLELYASTRAARDEPPFDPGTVLSRSRCRPSRGA